ncbi:hypothetical protein Trydic_g11554 [Trypoxylus dichotomus]
MQYIPFALFNLVLFLCFELISVRAEIGPYHGKVVACYWSTWSIYRPGRGKFQLEDVNPTLCTHLIFAFTLLDDKDSSIKTIGTWTDLTLDSAKRNNVSKLKEKYPHLKVLVSIGGWQDGSIKYSKMAANPHMRNNFINNTIDFIREHNFDGLDLVWEFPTKRGGSLHDKVNFVQLIKELRAAYDEHNFLLTAALGASKDTIDNGYDISELSMHLDYMFMMCYDYSGMWSRMIGPNAPLHGPDLLNVEYTINHMLKLGADPDKLIIGIPFYGRTFLRLETNVNNIIPPRLGEKFRNTSFNGSFTQEEGFMGYNEICLGFFDGSANWTVFWDELSKTPYAVDGEKMIVYDNHRSISEKIKFAMNQSLGGVMIWSIDTDDFRGDCYEIVNGQRDFPLLRTVDKEIHDFLRYQSQHPANIKVDLHIARLEISDKSNRGFFKTEKLLEIIPSGTAYDITQREGYSSYSIRNSFCMLACPSIFPMSFRAIVSTPYKFSPFSSILATMVVGVTCPIVLFGCCLSATHFGYSKTVPYWCFSPCSTPIIAAPSVLPSAEHVSTDILFAWVTSLFNFDPPSKSIGAVLASTKGASD